MFQIYNVKFNIINHSTFTENISLLFIESKNSLNSRDRREQIS